MDNRFTFLDKIAKVFYDLQLPYKLLVLKNDKGFSSKYLTLINDKLTMTDIKKYSDESKILLDICRKKQVGLSFRIFESLGCHKKIITTNKDIINYDFYNPSNIFVIDEENVVIDTSFIESNYLDIPNHIYDKYTIKGWLDTINQE